ncbi:MAG: tryptophan 2,3-dioxygenase family protein [Bacteriovorax sp.]|nr:tryptophan 2,3-dioxygenase family protein [Bacteriovorax sp.]
MHKNRGSVYYGDYLQLGKLLDSQLPLSRKYADVNNGECHDETLFIVVHQVYELWFKQIIHDLNSILKTFSQTFVPESELSSVVQKFSRIKKIQGLLIGQFDVLETMTPMDFLEFRDLLIPASGFQSAQFREIEIKLGLNTSDRQHVDREFFLGRLNEVDRNKLMELESVPSLLKLVEEWLERVPFTNMKNFNFWEEYQKSVEAILHDDEVIIEQNNAHLSEKAKNIQLENLALTRTTFKSLFDVNAHNELIKNKERTLSQKAILNALFIMLYRDESMLALPFQVLTAMMDIDENFTTWRYRHALLAQRMLGTKIGTGGSSGHQYLKRAADNNRVFVDLFNLSTFLIPRSRLPAIPTDVKKQLNFNV